ncbi:TPA: DUF4317 family protein [Clostridium botulinum]|nr:DUF4317 family protein [Clostridium botulinum]
MNKKELSGIRKVLKVDNDYKLRVGDIYNLYGKKDSKEIIFADKRAFGNLEEEEQELFLTNFKKMITGAIGTKLFELEFEAGDEGKTQQRLLCDILNKEDDFEVEEKEDNEEGTISASSIERILDSKGIETESIKNTITEITGDNTFDFKIDNIVPSSGKSIKINSSDANISLTPEALKNVKQVKNKSGRKCILIEIDENVSLEGFELEVEKL